MPSASVAIPDDLFKHGSEDDEFRVKARVIIAEELFCPSNGDETTKPNPESVTLWFRLYDSEDEDVVSDSKNTAVFIEIKGYPLPDRMANIKERLERIRDRTKALLPKDNNVISVIFNPVEENHWVVG
jgi:phenylpyruvate tautomerase PptA (4-oxalocrotonate tautomerase family)